jgi:hypothetical protein
MNSDTIVYCVIALIVGMLMYYLLKQSCGCRVVEGVEDKSPCKLLNQGETRRDCPNTNDVEFLKQFNQATGRECPGGGEVDSNGDCICLVTREKIDIHNIGYGHTCAPLLNDNTSCEERFQIIDNPNIPSIPYQAYHCKNIDGICKPDMKNSACIIDFGKSPQTCCLNEGYQQLLDNYKPEKQKSVCNQGEDYSCGDLNIVGGNYENFRGALPVGSTNCGGISETELDNMIKDIDDNSNISKKGRLEAIDTRTLLKKHINDIDERIHDTSRQDWIRTCPEWNSSTNSFDSTGTIFECDPKCRLRYKFKRKFD